jgi:gamma-butyrobetaine dioxygenase
MAPPLFEQDEIVNESDQTRKFFSTLISTGLALVSDVPRDEGECARFGERFSTLRETEWGKNFNVRSTPDTTTGVRKDLAYTPNKIGMHVDSPYRIDTPPAFQLLHAITHCSGPDCQVHNRFVDGFGVAQALCAHNREFFHVLTSTVLRWKNNGGDDSSLLYRYAPMLELEDIYGSDATTTTRPDDSSVCPSIKAVNFSAKSGGYAPNLPKEQLELFYQAKRKFSALLHSDEYAIRLQLYCDSKHSRFTDCDS